jgi:hypothetical protein
LWSLRTFKWGRSIKTRCQQWRDHCGTLTCSDYSTLYTSFIVGFCCFLVIFPSFSFNCKFYLLHFRLLGKHRKLRDPAISTTCTHSVHHRLYSCFECD